MRQFIALEPSPGFLSALEELQDCLRAGGVAREGLSIISNPRKNWMAYAIIRRK